VAVSAAWPGCPPEGFMGDARSAATMLVGDVRGLSAPRSFACCECVNPLPGETGKPQGWERSGSNLGCTRHLPVAEPVWKAALGGLRRLLVLGEEVPTKDS